MTDFGRRPAVAAANILPKTGQTTSYVDGDDGYYEKGWADTERFTDNGDGTVTDNATGLMWPKDIAGTGVNQNFYMTWEDAMAWAEALDFAGHQDWRMPNRLEILSISNRETYGPNLYPIFENRAWEWVWSSSTLQEPGGNLRAVILDMWEGMFYEWAKNECAGGILPVRTA